MKQDIHLIYHHQGTALLRACRQGTGGPMAYGPLHIPKCGCKNAIFGRFIASPPPLKPQRERLRGVWLTDQKRSGGNAWRFLSIFCGSFTNHTLLAPFLSSHLISGRNETNSNIKNPGFVVIPSDLLNLSTSAQQNAIRPRETVSNRFSQCFIAIQKKSLDSLDHLPSGSLHRTYVNIPLPIPR